MALFETVVDNSLEADWDTDMGFFRLLVSDSNTCSDRVMRSDKDMPLNATSVEEKKDRFLGRPVFRPTSFWCKILKIVLALLRYELSELSLILDRESFPIWVGFVVGILKK